jgi:tRNA (uracil-5-)-methyltransferase/23S rRNA (uracil1939-C5)-methyltransferase
LSGILKIPDNTVLKNTPLPREGTLFFRSSASWCGEIGNAPEEYLTEILPEAGEFRIPAAGFFQTNPAVAAELCSRVTEAIGRYGAKKMLELFCGAGIFSIAAARKFPDLRCRGIELDPHSIKAAKINAKLNQTADRCSFLAGDAAAFTAEDYDVVLLDPPRSGLEKKLVRKLLDRAYPLLLYVSCGPDTLQRDLELLAERYTVLRAGALDMFPCTAHFETFTILSLRKQC